MKTRTLYSLLLLFFIFGFSSCKKEDTQEKTVKADVNAVLTNYARNIIVPAYIQFQSDVYLLEKATDLYTSGDLSSLKVAYKNAYISWQACAPFDFGPASTHSLIQNINVYPVNNSTIAENIRLETKDITPTSEASSKGFGAIDTLLFTKNDLNVAEVKYLKKVIIDIKSRVDNTVKEWNQGYADAFTANVGYGKGSSINLLMNAYIKFYEKEFRTGKIGIPLGLSSSGTLQPKRVEAFYSGYSTELLKASTQSLSSIYYGKGGLGIHYLLKSDDSSINEAVLTDLDNGWNSILSRINTINSPLNTYIAVNKAETQKLYTDIQVQLVLLKIDVMSALSLELIFNSGDGD